MDSLDFYSFITYKIIVTCKDTLYFTLLVKSFRVAISPEKSRRAERGGTFSCILRDKNANDIEFCGSCYDKDYGYLK